MPLVTLINGKTFDGSAGSSILESALLSSITLEYSCKTGRCGVCVAKVTSGETEAIRVEEALTSDQVQSGQILTCCRQAKSDVCLEVEDLPQLEGIKVKTYPARVDEVLRLNNDVVEVLFRLPPNSQFNYLPGQYISVIGPGAVRRSYSIANAPRPDGKLSLQIKKVAGGILSEYWFEKVKVNDLLRFEGPLGTFFFRQATPHKLLLLATGTGIAPIIALLQHLDETPNEKPEEIHVYWGNRHESDIYLDLVSKFSKNIKITLVLSQPSHGWQGAKGYVQQIALGQHPELLNTEVYACGSNSMIQSAKHAFEASGLSPHKFYSDAFVSSSN
jgi:CDP-4-dehydro-6-deoxyglucose reductase